MAVELLFSGTERGRTRIIYTVDGKGPFVEHLSKEADVQAHLAMREAEISAEPIPEEPTPEDEFRAIIEATDPEVVKAVLKIDDATLEAAKVSDAVKR